MEKTSIESEEAYFDISELFVSRTDKKGVILSGNSVFVRVSGYTSEQLFGRPHNIIRHADMPRAIFRLFWQTISDGRNIVAYVKNRDISGRFYWVLATVFPTKDGYLSVRVKPTSPLLKVAEDLYAELRVVEDQGGIDASTALLHKRLQELGFADYWSFMITALKTELEARDMAMEGRLPRLSGIFQDRRIRELASLRESISDMLISFKSTTGKMSELEKIQSYSASKTSEIARSVERISCLSVNMSIAAHKMSKEGAALAVIANTVQDMAHEILGTYDRFILASNEVLALLDRMLFGVLRIRTNLEMLSFNLGEVIDEARSQGHHGPKTQAQIQELSLLSTIASELCAENTRVQAEFFASLANLSRESSQLYTQIVRLGLVRTGGKLEGARTTKVAEVFGPFVAELGIHIDAIERPLSELSGFFKNATTKMSDLVSGAKLVEHALSEVTMSLSGFSERESTVDHYRTGT